MICCTNSIIELGQIRPIVVKVLSLVYNNNNLCILHRSVSPRPTGVDMDEACVALALFCPLLKSLSAWMTRGMSERGLMALASIATLQDIDLGWVFSGAVTLSTG